MLYFMDQYLGGKANIQEKHGCELHLVSDHITLQAYKWAFTISNIQSLKL